MTVPQDRDLALDPHALRVFLGQQKGGADPSSLSWLSWTDPTKEIEVGPDGSATPRSLRLDGATDWSDARDSESGGVRIAVLGTGAAPHQSGWLEAAFDASDQANPREAGPEELARGLPEWALDRAGHETQIIDILHHHAPGCRMSVVRLSESQLATPSSMARALHWCARRKFDLIQMSWAGYPSTSEDPAIERVRGWIGRLASEGALTVVAAGNWAQDPDQVPRGAGAIGCPGDLDEVLTVGATEFVEGIWQLSPHSAWGSLGRYKPDVLGPGRWTSTAAAHVTGMIARLIGALRIANKYGPCKAERLSPQALIELLRNTAERIGDIPPHGQGAGIAKPARWIRRLESEPDQPLGFLAEHVLQPGSPPSAEAAGNAPKEAPPVAELVPPTRDQALAAAPTPAHPEPLSAAADNNGGEHRRRWPRVLVAGCLLALAVWALRMTMADRKTNLTEEEISRSIVTDSQPEESSQLSPQTNKVPPDPGMVGGNESADDEGNSRGADLVRGGEPGNPAKETRSVDASAQQSMTEPQPEAKSGAPNEPERTAQSDAAQAQLGHSVKAIRASPTEADSTTAKENPESLPVETDPIFGPLPSDYIKSSAWIDSVVDGELEDPDGR